MFNRDGGPAFPCTTDTQGRSFAHEKLDESTQVRVVLVENTGMSMRQFYKAAALQGMLACGKDHNFNYSGDTSLAKCCGGLADAMLAEDEEHAKK